MKSKQKGFTIIEMMLSVAVSSIIAFGIFGVLLASNRQLEVIHARMTLQEGPREALYKMAQEIRQTAWHKIVVNFGAADENGIERSNTINFVVPVPNPDPTYLIDGNYSPKWASNIEYKLDGIKHQILRVSTDLTTNEVKEAVLANEVTSLEFSRKTGILGLITITAAAQREFPDGRKIPDEPIRMIAQAETRNP